MKILFVRHGESVDDIEDRYGGWADFELTKKGEEQIKVSAGKIKSLNEKFELILTSPLKRALQTAEILSEEFNLNVEVLEYVKEANRYGILTGMKISDALEKYPDQVHGLEEHEYVDGGERLEDFLSRIKKSLNYIKKTNKKSVIVVTHGSYLKVLFENLLGKKLLKKDDGGFVLMKYEDGNLLPLKSDGIEYE